MKLPIYFKTGRLYAVRARYRSYGDQYEEAPERDWLWMNASHLSDNEVEFFDTYEAAVLRAQDVCFDSDKYEWRVVTTALEYTNYER